VLSDCAHPVVVKYKTTEEPSVLPKSGKLVRRGVVLDAIEARFNPRPSGIDALAGANEAHPNF
jgi:hypothetical protein